MSVNSPVIIITGASRGLGLSVLRILLQRYDARVTTLSRSLSTELETDITEHGQDRVLAIQGDVRDIQTNRKVVLETLNKWGRLDGVVVNAGSIEPLGENWNPPYLSVSPVSSDQSGTRYISNSSLQRRL